MDDKGFLSQLVDTAKACGADHSDAIFNRSQDVSVKCIDGKLETIQSRESSAFSLRVFVGNRTASVSSTLLSDEETKSLIKNTIVRAKYSPEDPYAGLVPAESLAHDLGGDLEILDETEVAHSSLIDTALEIESSALSIPKIERCVSAHASAGRKKSILCTSNGFLHESSRSSFSRYCEALAADQDSMESEGHMSTEVFHEDLVASKTIGRIAGERAAARLGAQRMKTGQWPVIFESTISNSLLGIFVNATTGSSISSGTSFLQDEMEKKVFGSGVQIVDDPLLKRGKASRVHDGEGTSCKRIDFIKNGVLRSWFLNMATARRLDLCLTGHAGPLGTDGSPSNLYMAAGNLSPSELRSDIELGFYVTGLLGSGASIVSGDYSIGATGFLIEKGEITTPVREATIAGNLRDMFMALTPASDLEFRYGINAPTMRVDGMMVAGV